MCAEYDVMTITAHNSFYATERRAQPKEYFKFLASQANDDLASAGTILDIGCATGEFLGYIGGIYRSASLTGIDTDPIFVEKAQRSVPEASFKLGDIDTGAGLPKSKSDVVFMLGVNIYFSNFRWLDNLVRITRKVAYVFGVFNPEPLDVRCQVSRPGEPDSQSWNLISQKSISDYLKVPHRFIPWELPIANPRTHSDPMRSWTIPTDNGYLVVNGMQLVHRFAALEIRP